MIVYADGKVCISILHPPVRSSAPAQRSSTPHFVAALFSGVQGDDEYGYEKASERWTPIHTVETILISVISMLSDPNDESPANLEAAVPLILTPLLIALLALSVRMPLTGRLSLFSNNRNNGERTRLASRRRCNSASAGRRRCSKA
jgi:hypothetical protein